MTDANATDVDVFVVGAGPTGLAAANEALRHGLSVRIVDAKEHRSTYSKALVAHARTLEAFEAMGMVAAIRDAGVPFTAMHVLPDARGKAIRVDLLQLDWGDTRYPYWLSIPQYATERCLEEHLQASGVAVDWQTAFELLTDHGDHVEATVVAAAGARKVYRAKWLIGCDGGRSAVRTQASIEFERESIGETFVIADAVGNAPIPQDEGMTSLANDALIFLVPMPEPERWRIIAHMPDHPEDRPLDIDGPFVDRLIAERLGFDFGARDITWTSQFVLKQGLAENYRRGRIFIAGDAAHLHSPVGGQGLNTGVQDAYALIWRIALAERSTPTHETLFDSYTAERRSIAAQMVKSTTRATAVMTTQNRLATRARGFIARRALELDSIQNKLGRTVGMLELDCEGSPIVVPGIHGTVGPGARVPNPTSGEGRLHNVLDAQRHTVLLLGADTAALAADFGTAGVRCVRVGGGSGPGGGSGRGADFVDTDGGLHESLGGARLVIVRPDRVIAAAHGELDPSVVYRYARETLGVAPTAL